MSDVMNLIVHTDLFVISNKNNNNAQVQEVMDYTEFLKIEYEKYRKYKILLDGIEECVEDDNNNLEEGLRNKIKRIMLGERISQIGLGDLEESFDAVLGVPLGNIELTYIESSKVLSCLKVNLDNKSLKLKVRDHFTMSDSPLELSCEDSILFEFRNKLTLEQEAYIKNQYELLDLLEKLKNIRLKTLSEVTDRKIQECGLKSKINYLKSQLAREKCRLDIFIETSTSLEAYTEIIKDIKAHQEELRLDIEQLKDLKEKYSQVSCKEYEDILKMYLQYKSSFEKKKMMYDLYV